MNGRKARLTIGVVVIGLAAFACARSYERRASAPAAAAEPVAAAPVAAAAEDEPPPPPVDPFEGITGDPAIGFSGDEALLRASPARSLRVPSFDVACLRGEDAVRAPDELDARLVALAETQQVALGRLRFVRFESDPAVQTSRRAPRLCRPVRADAVLYAPLFRESEPASLWLIDAAGDDVNRTVAATLKRAASERARAAGPPRALVVRGEIVGVALPVVASEAAEDR